MNTRVCKKCGFEKEIVEFYKTVPQWCKACHSVYTKTYYASHKEEAKAYVLANREYIAQQRREYEKANRKAIKLQRLKYKDKLEKSRAIWEEENRELRNAQQRERYLKNGISKRYGLLFEAYQLLLAQQDNCCAICRKPVKLCVDHDHLTGKVRGLLCHPCNRLLGHSKDDPTILRAAATYLEHNQSTT